MRGPFVLAIGLIPAVYGLLTGSEVYQTDIGGVTACLSLLVLTAVCLLGNQHDVRTGILSARNVLVAHYALIFIPTVAWLGISQITFFDQYGLAGPDRIVAFAIMAGLVPGCLGVFLVVYERSIRRRSRVTSAEPDAAPPSEKRLAPNVAWVFAVMCTCGYLAFGAFLYGMGGLSGFLDARATWRTLGVSGSGAFVFPATTLLFVGACPLLVSLARDFNDRRSLVWFVMVLGIAIYPTYVFGFRVALVPMICTACHILAFYRFKLRLKHAAIIGVIGLVLLSWMGLVRDKSHRDDYLELASVYFFDSFLLRSNGAEVVCTVIENGGDANGWGSKTVLEAATILVPRQIAAWKPVPFFEKFSQEYFSQFFVVRAMTTGQTHASGISPTLPGQLIHDFGITGCIIAFLILGYFAARVDSTNPRCVRGWFQILALFAALRFFLALPESVQGALNNLVLELFAGAIVSVVIIALPHAFRRGRDS
jgi:hypothetical protein